MSSTPRRSRSRIARTATALALAVTGFAPSARATDPSDKSAAEALFREGRARMEQGRYAEACPKLAESQRLDPAAGTLMNLGQCYERNHQTASAWVTFTEAAKAAAARRRDDWRATALARVRALEPKLAYVVIAVPEEARVPGLAVKRDASEVREPEWGTAIPVDAGPHEIGASATGHVAWSKTISVVDAARTTVTIPTLVAAPVAAAPVVAPSAPDEGAARPPERDRDRPSGAPPLRVVGYVALGVGAAGLITGAVTGLVAASASKQADRACPSSRCSDPSGIDANTRAHTFATVSTIGFVAGAALAAGGLALVLWGGGESASSHAARPGDRRAWLGDSLRVEAVPTANGGGLRLAGQLW